MENPMFDLLIGNVPGVRDVFMPLPVERTTRAVQTESQGKVTKELTPILPPLSDSETEGVTKFEDETLHQAVKCASSDRIGDSISPDDSVAVEMTIDEVTTSTAAEVNEIRSESMQPKPESKYQYFGNECAPLNPGEKKQCDRNFL